LIASDLLNEEPGLIDLIDKFIARIPLMRDEINHALTSNNIQELEHVVHQLKGTGGGYGYPMLTDICVAIEEQIEAQNIKLVAKLINDLNSIVDKIIKGKEENHKIAVQGL